MSSSTTKKSYRILFSVLSAILGILFLVSAFSKTMPVSPFIDSIYDRFYLTYQVSSILAKAIIGFEAGLGILLIIGLYGKWRWVLYSVFGMLIAFTAFIIIIWINEGSNADCGCMGEWVKFSPFESILKNIVMLAIVCLLIFKDKKRESTSRFYFAWIIPVLFICYPFIFVSSDLGIDQFYPTEANDSIQAPPIELREGKNIVAFLSFTCGHCRDAAAIFSEIKKEYPDLPILFIFSNHFMEEEAINGFLEDSRANDIPRYYIPKKMFRSMAGNGVPSIYLLEGSEIKDKVDRYRDMKGKDLYDWYKK